MNEHYYLYALTRGDCPADSLGQGVDPRFPVEIVPCRQTSGVASRVGLDKFDVRKLESGSTDVNWLSEVAIRHNQILSDLARRRPLLPLRLGTLFHSRLTLLAKIERWESVVIDYLNSIGDRQEWAAKIYVDPRHIEEDSAASCCVSSAQAGDAGAGTRYLTQKLGRQRESRAMRQRFQEEIAAAETSLMNQADRYCRTRTLPANLTGRQEKMLWNAAFLLPRSVSERWLTLVEKVRSETASVGLLLEVSGPWPPYHFCPTLDT
ncbi:MAG: GvpL/GvpF family gas vesicle protein [Thermoguttaceae bacterium]|jgi:hypothetical protein